MKKTFELYKKLKLNKVAPNLYSYGITQHGRKRVVFFTTNNTTIPKFSAYVDLLNILLKR